MYQLLIPLLILPSLLMAAEVRPDNPERPLVQVAILLDDSGSMQGLLRQARAHLWEVVGQVSALTRQGLKPRVQVALYHYGDQSFLSQPLVGMTDDLDEISRQLFCVNGGGGEEHCGEVILNAVSQLAWSPRAGDLKMILIAGNEPFSQGPIDWRSACRAAAARGIVINTIHCGSEAEGRSGSWDEGARLAEGRFLCIDQDHAVAAIAAPQDDLLRDLNAKLNATYLPYGAHGNEACANQAEQDANAYSSAPQAGSSRAAVKASGSYRNSRWDLVDALHDDPTTLDRCVETDLPPELRGLARAELTQRIAAAAATRAAVQQEILRVDAERQRFVAAEEAKLAGASGATYGTAVQQAISEQATKAGWTVTPR